MSNETSEKAAEFADYVERNGHMFKIIEADGNLRKFTNEMRGDAEGRYLPLERAKTAMRRVELPDELVLKDGTEIKTAAFEDARQKFLAEVDVEGRFDPANLDKFVAAAREYTTPIDGPPPSRLVDLAMKQGRDPSAARDWLREYMDATQRFATYTMFVRSMTVIDLTREFPKLAYEAIALCEEVGEFAEKVGALLATYGDDCWNLDTDERRGLILELGDVMFYVHLSYIGIGHIAHPTPGDPDGLVELSMRLSAAAGKFGGAVKKLHRDDKGAMSDARSLLLAERLGAVYDVLKRCIDALGSTIDEVATENIAKIQSRLARGTLAGSGDDR